MPVCLRNAWDVLHVQVSICSVLSRHDSPWPGALMLPRRTVKFADVRLLDKRGSQPRRADAYTPYVPR